jgi:hypothetical protein
MDPHDTFLLSRLQTALDEVIVAAAKGMPLYRENPKLVADVSRKAKWLQKAIQTFQESHDQPRPAA